MPLPSSPPLDEDKEETKGDEDPKAKASINQFPTIDQLKLATGARKILMAQQSPLNQRWLERDSQPRYSKDRDSSSRLG
jgi:hypothetical protein